MDIVPAGVPLDVATDAAGKPVAVYRKEDGTEWKPPGAAPTPTAQPEAKLEPESAEAAEGDGEPYRLNAAGFQSMSQEFLAAEVAGVDFAPRSASSSS
jgi:hypothetical protein